MTPVIISPFHFEEEFALDYPWDIICYVSLGLFAIYFSFGLCLGCKFYKRRKEQILVSRFSKLTIWEITFILLKIVTNFFVILSDLIAANIEWDKSDIMATYIRQIAFHFGILLEYCVVYTWLYRFWCIYYSFNWVIGIYNLQWQKLINEDLQHSTNNWFLNNKKTWGNYKYLRKYIITIILISSGITIPLRYMFDFAEDEWDYIGVTCHSLFLLIPAVFIGYIWIKLPKFEDFIYVGIEMRYIGMILLTIYVIGLVISEIVENVFRGQKNKSIDEEDQIKILIIYYNLKEFGNFICLWIATGWVLKMVEPLILIGTDNDYSTKRRMAQKTYRPKLTQTRDRYHTNSSNNSSTYISEDKELLEDQLDVFENMSNLPIDDYSRASSLKDRDKITAIQTGQGIINISDVLSHPKAFDIFMLHLSREFRYDRLRFCVFIFIY